MDEGRLAEIEARLHGVSPGPWRHGSLWDDPERTTPATSVLGSAPAVDEDGVLVTHTFCLVQPWQHVVVEDEDDRQEHVDWLCRCEADARFLAHAPQDVADLVAAVHRLRRGLREDATTPGGGDGEQTGR